MKRIITIAKYQFKGLNVFRFISLIRESLFRNDTILIYRLNLFESGDIKRCALDEIEIKKGAISDLFMSQEKMSPLPWEFRCHKYDEVKDFFVAVNRDGIQHISWIYYQGDPNRIIALGPKDAEIKYCLTLPSFRGKGLYPRVLRTIACYLGQRGFCRVFISANVENRTSIRGILKAGFVYENQIRVRKIFGFQVSKRYCPSER